MDVLQDNVLRKIGPWSSLLEGSLPCYDILEGKDSVLVKLNVPGVTEDDLSIHPIGESSLVIRGTRRKGVEGFNYVHEGRAEEVRKFVFIPRDVDLDAAEARLESGVLTIEVPKEESMGEGEVKGTKIPVS